MTNAPYDLRDYLFDELTPAQRREMERYLESSPEAREELDRLRLTQQALESLPGEEIPRRIAFVSDKVFEPSPWQRWWRGLAEAAPRFALAAAALLLAVSAALWLAKPTISGDENGWRIAFGATETASEGRPDVQQADLNQQRIREAVLAVLAETQDERLDSQRRALAELVARESAKSRKMWKQEIEQLREETKDAWFLLKASIDSLDRELSQVNLASHDGGGR